MRRVAVIVLVVGFSAALLALLYPVGQIGTGRPGQLCGSPLGWPVASEPVSAEQAVALMDMPQCSEHAQLRVLIAVACAILAVMGAMLALSVGWVRGRRRGSAAARTGVVASGVPLG